MQVLLRATCSTAAAVATVSSARDSLASLQRLFLLLLKLALLLGLGLLGFPRGRLEVHLYKVGR